ncbi:glycosyltransferase [Rubrivirga sp. S365]|uniref:Glycosyltransferase n=1 Tax=Rubrivirga litoralis TaxID=3075598 RepID=A0ABU3BTI8_9BACT|nr:MULTISPECIES: glycosyltransferase [unclassified Rubrivirga]MDT0632608.1 glycosyltransferase [Rubrivirga sp. F394]MDT7855430.1 glycosyltransferase [Rubrivirga sp. S365]
MPPPLDIVVLGLSITSSWGNGHATTYRALVRALDAAGHRVLFLERDKPWYADNRDLPAPPYGTTRLYDSLDELKDEHADAVRRADLVVVGSYVPDGVAVGDWAQATAGGAVAFYDIDTPVTLAKLGRGDTEYLAPRQIPGYDLYLSFTGGPTLDRLEREFGSPAARPLYCSVDPEAYAPDPAAPPTHDLGYMGTYSDDRQPGLERLLLHPARQWRAGRFVVAGPGYPDDVAWPDNVDRVDHLPPAEHRAFYTSQRWTLNLTRADMVAAGYAPSVRLFEAAACATPVVSDWWEGLDSFFVPGEEIVIARSSEEALSALQDTPDDERRRIGERARARVLAAHTAAHRAEELVGYVHEARAATA